jgi:hypothetical protein
MNCQQGNGENATGWKSFCGDRGVFCIFGLFTIRGAASRLL